MPEPEDRLTSVRFEGLSIEDLALVKEMVTPDQSSKLFGMTPASTKRFLEGMPLSALSPEPVRAAAKRIDKLLVFGLLEYEFYTMACDECVRLSELALVSAIGPTDRRKRVPYLKKQLGTARERGFIPQRITEKQLEALCGLRNEAAHPRECHLLPPARAFETYVVTIDLVNCLFDAEWRSREPEPVRRIRKRYQGMFQALSKSGIKSR
jgi:hypothetical protein